MSPAGPSARSPLRTLILLAAILALVFLAYSSLRLAWADHLSRSTELDSVARAVRLSPDSADFRLKLAAAQQAAGADPTASLDTAVRLEPLNADAWMRLGTAAEVRGDPAAAENSLLQAARVSRQFAPRWALANFYFRRGDAERFWVWTRASVRMGYGDLNPLFQLCWRMGPDAGPILEHAIPDRPAVLNSYIRFLLQEGRLTASEQPAARLAALGTADDESTLTAWCNRQLDAGSVPAALAVWNTMCERHLVPYAPQTADGVPLPGGDFAAPFGSGFAWRLVPTPGVTTGRNQSPQFGWVAFSGGQPEICAALLRYIPVTASREYRLRFAYRTTEMPAASGLRWTVYDARKGIDVATISPWLSGAGWKPEEVRFRAPDSAVVRLTLTCQRLPGATRLRGTVDLRGLALERLP
ncbi:MAG TPA: hypothetical protein VKR61_23960 [Bryobacteraceae bacterium]|nr:hypothetical protein [Bryobacteraceae bacterium]